jgi:hypothetical protein
LPVGVGTLSAQGLNSNIVSGTAQSISGSPLTVNFTGIPSWVKRVTVMYSGMTTNGTSLPQIQIGSGGHTTSGYASYAGYVGSNTGSSTSTSGFLLGAGGPASGSPYYGTLTLTLVNSSTNLWVGSMTSGVQVAGNYGYCGAGSVAISGVITQLRFITVNVTDLFTAGSVNILYE